MADGKASNSNIGVGTATDGNGGNNMNTDQTGQQGGGGGGQQSTSNSKPKSKNNDAEYRAILEKSLYKTQAINWYENMSKVFGIETVKKMNAKTAAEKQIKQEALNNVQTMAFKLTQSLIGSVTTAVDQALKVADNRYKKK